MAFYASYDESMLDFHSAEQLRWLRSNQYPMPEDILTASKLTEEELLADYQRGNLQAGFFYLDRVSSRSASGEMETRERQELDGVARTFLSSGSPLAGYAYYNYQQKVHQDPHAAFAGLALASDFGDRRASLVMMNQAFPNYIEKPGSLDPIRLLSAYRIVLSNIRSRNPNLLTRRWPPFPGSTP